MRFIHRSLHCLEKIFILFSVGSLVLIVLLTTVDAGGRYLLSLTISGVYEVEERYLMAFLVFFGLCYAYSQGANVRVTFLVSRFPQKIKLFVNYLAQILSILFCSSIFFTSIIFTIQRFDDVLHFPNYKIPLAPAYISVPVGLCLMVVRMILDLREVKRDKSGLLKG